MKDTDFAVGGGVPGREAEETEDGDSERDRQERVSPGFRPSRWVDQSVGSQRGDQTRREPA